MADIIDINSAGGEEENLFLLEDENGNEVPFEFVDLMEYEGEEYLFLLPVEDDDGEETQLDIADESQSPELLLERSLTRDAVRRGLDALPPDYRQILLLREIQGLSYDEISLALDLEVGTVKSRIFRARKKLCAFLIADGNIPDLTSSGKSGGGGRL